MIHLRHDRFRNALVLSLFLTGAAICGAQVTDQDLLKPDPANFLLYSGTYDSQRHSLLKQITTANVANLERAWTYKTGSARFAGAPMVVDRRVPERPVEPRHDRFAVAKRLELGEPAREGLLENVLREIAPTESTLQEAQELAVVLDEHALHVGIDRSHGVGFCLRPAHDLDVARLLAAREIETQGPVGIGRPRVFSSSFAYAVNLLSVGCRRLRP